ncbi:MAG: hypothetical protein ABIJ61_03070 [bacterium]
MKRAILIAVMSMIAATLLWSCSSESPETQALYTDAKAMYDEITAAFQLPGNSPERTNTMKAIIVNEKDIKLISNLEQYLREAPDGKYAKQAKDLLDMARQNMNIRMLGQLRPLMPQTGGETPEEQIDSLMKMKPGAAKDS